MAAQTARNLTASICARGGGAYGDKLAFEDDLPSAMGSYTLHLGALGLHSFQPGCAIAVVPIAMPIPRTSNAVVSLIIVVVLLNSTV